ncbi:MAG: ABC transporter permease [Bacteroidetes bacterium]|nr:ABC transporter permease [Bacteroidota bacterium]
MLKYYLKITGRNIIRTKGFFIINILGLSIGIACAIFIYLYVYQEFSYDKYYPDYQRIYRVISKIQTNTLTYERIAASPPLAKVLREDFPQVEKAIRFSRGQMKTPVRFNDSKVNIDRPLRVDQDFFELFPQKIVKGLTKDQVTRPSTAVITENLAKILFGNIDPIGKVIINDTLKYEVTAVIEDWPDNSHMNPDLICSWHPSPFINTDMLWMDEGWGGQSMTYIKLREGTDVSAFAETLKPLEAKYNVDPQDREGMKRIVYHYLQPLKDIHLQSHDEFEMKPSGNLSYLKVFMTIGMLILFIACINYMNLTTAKFMNRVREIGIRKTVGAGRKTLIVQFLFESFIYVFIAHVIAMFLVEFFLPSVNQLLDARLKVDYSNPALLISIGILILFTSLLSGSYPALFLSSLKPILIFQGNIKTGFVSVWIRKGLVIFQFAVSVGLIISVMLIYKQLNFMKNYPLGFDKEQKLVLRFPREVIGLNEYKQIKQEFLKIPQVNKSAFCSSIPGEWNYGWRTYLPGEENIRTFLVNYYQVDEDFTDLIDLQFIAGNSFKPGNQGSRINEMMINESALKTFGWSNAEEAIGKYIWNDRTRIVGVFKDFHFKGLQESVGPMGIYQMTDDFKLFVLDIKYADYLATLKQIETTYNSLMPNYPFEYFFLDQNFDKQYKSEEQMGQFLTVLSLLGIFIACIGLLGLASFMTQQRTKEIGIRKVNGASIPNILSLLVGSFSIWILVANIIAWPVSFYLLKKWLENFAYQTTFSWWIFALAGFISLILAICTVLYQSYIAAKSNPVDSLKSE